MLRSQPCTQLCPKLLPGSRRAPYPPATAVSLHQWMLLFTDWSKMSRSNSLWQWEEKKRKRQIIGNERRQIVFSWTPRCKMGDVVSSFAAQYTRGCRALCQALTMRNRSTSRRGRGNVTSIVQASTTNFFSPLDLSNQAPEQETKAIKQKSNVCWLLFTSQTGGQIWRLSFSSIPSFH